MLWQSCAVLYHMLICTQKYKFLVKNALIPFLLLFCTNNSSKCILISCLTLIMNGVTCCRGKSCIQFIFSTSNPNWVLIWMPSMFSKSRIKWWFIIYRFLNFNFDVLLKYVWWIYFKFKTAILQYPKGSH